MELNIYYSIFINIFMIYICIDNMNSEKNIIGMIIYYINKNL